MSDEQKTFRVRVLVMKNDRILFNGWYDVMDNKFEEPLKVMDAGCDHCCHGVQDYLKEAAFHASLVEAGK